MSRFLIPTLDDDDLDGREGGLVAGTVPLDDRTSNYTILGDWLGISCLAVTIGLVPMGFLRGRVRLRA